MPGTLTATKTNDRPRLGVQKVSLAWTTSSMGAFSGNTIALFGTITRVTFVPGAGGVQPSDDYDVTLLDAEGVDLLAGLGANRDNVNTETVYPLLGAGTNIPAVAAGPVQLVVTNAGNSKSGTVHMYLNRATP